MDAPGEGKVEPIAVGALKPRSSEPSERVASGRIGRLVLTHQGCAVAAVAPVREGYEPVELWGALRGLIEPVEGVDLTTPVGGVCVAERG